MANEEKPKGQLFTHVYLDRNKPVQDSPLFRKRIGYFFDWRFEACRWRTTEFLKLEMGLDVMWNNKGPSLEVFFHDIELHYLKNAITLVSRSLKNLQKEATYRADPMEWRQFVKRALKEENLSYYLDEECGVHPLVDEEFEHNKVSALACLMDPKYSGVRTEFEHAFKELDTNPPHTKDAVKAIFESIEILVRQMVETKNLNKWVVQNSLKEKALEVYKDDPTARDAVEKMFESFGFWVDAIHHYRHGQGVSEPVEPPMEFAVYALSSGTSFLRWLVEIDMAIRTNQ